MSHGSLSHRHRKTLINRSCDSLITRSRQHETDKMTRREGLTPRSQGFTLTALFKVALTPVNSETMMDPLASF